MMIAKRIQKRQSSIKYFKSIIRDKEVGPGVCQKKGKPCNTTLGPSTCVPIPFADTMKNKKKAIAHTLSIFLIVNLIAQTPIRHLLGDFCFRLVQRKLFHHKVKTQNRFHREKLHYLP